MEENNQHRNDGGSSGSYNVTNNVFLPIMIVLIIVCGSNGSAIVPKKHFVLVHGGCHGAWSWYKLETMLRSAGHNISAFDLAASGIDLRQPIQLLTLSDYFDPLFKFMEALPVHEKVVLVAHSYGGWGISKAMEMFPHKISVAIFVTAVMPGPTLSAPAIMRQFALTFGPQLDNQTFSGPETDAKNQTVVTLLFSPNFLAANLYQLSPPEDLTLATKLMRPLRTFSDDSMFKEIRMTRARYGSVHRVFIITEEDRLFDKELTQRWMIERNPPNEVKQIKSDHMAMLSNVDQLLALLMEITQTYS